MGTLTHVLFDLDGTITDSKSGILRSIQYALAECGRTVPPEEELLPCLGPPLLDSFRGIWKMDKDEADRAVKAYRERFSNVGMFENQVYDGVPEMFASLRDAGITLAIATSKPEVYARKILENFQLTPFFATISGCDINREGETKTDMIHQAFRRLGLPCENPQNVVMVGDRKYDIIGAHACSIPCVGVRYGYAPAGELEEYHADFILDTPAELTQFLREF